MIFRYQIEGNRVLIKNTSKLYQVKVN